MNRSAVLHDEKYRYLLTRGPSDGSDGLGVIMLNPSTADAFVDDPTIRRLMKFAELWGYPQLEVVNLFAYRSPHPKDLETVDDPVGPCNEKFLLGTFRLKLVLVAWGATQIGRAQIRDVVKMARKRDVTLHCLGVNADGSPIHPMARGKNRVPDDATPVPWEPNV